MAVTRRGARYKPVTLTIHGPEGQQLDVRLNPKKKYDAVFFDLYAVDRLLVPFYAGRHGLEAAVKFRTEVAHQMKRTSGTVLVLHKWYCTSRVRFIAWSRKSVTL